jgi:hypothetical protein
MTILERKSERKKKALKLLVETGEYTIAFAMIEAERLNDEGKLLDNDYEELMEYLESLLEPTEEPTDEDFGLEEENTEESPEEENLEET